MNKKANESEAPNEPPGKNNVPPLEELIADLVHKLNNPLAAILGYSELILPKIEDHEIKKDMEMIRKEAEHASHIVKNLVAFTRKRTLKKKWVDLNRLIDETFGSKTDELKLKNILVKTELSRPLPLTLADPQQIKQVFVNIINNAEEAISKSHGFGEIRARSLVTDGQIEMTFTDDGPGIRKEDILKIFSLFFSTKSKGIGLGLPISHSIIMQHGGRMWGESEWGNGATFFITLPIVKREEQEAQKKSENGREGLQGARGLVIDDELPVLTFVSKYLFQEGAKIETARNVESALRVIEERDFDFIVCDMRMPGMDGEGFYCIVGRKASSLQDKIIFSTGDVMSRKTKAFLNSIKNPCVEKPFNLKNLKEVIVDLLNSVTH